MEKTPLIFLKLGGSLITDKTHPSTYRPEVLRRLASEIALVWEQNPHQRLILGHGSGSYGHTAADRHGTVHGVQTPTQWAGFAEVWAQARELNQIVIQTLLSSGLPVMAFPPSAGMMAEDGLPVEWDLSPLRAALAAHLLPVVQGDVVFDLKRGGTVVSTEDVFTYLARRLNPQRILLAGIEKYVWGDYPDRTQPIPEIKPDYLEPALASLRGAEAIDVTGGMSEKVHRMLALVRTIPDLEVVIFSGEEPGLVRDALLGASPGTVIHNQDWGEML
ncbi:MAG: isopentenyl phosphate kinase [Chloroflexi bacterium]|nr:isopentenyl phosphate kinase [Chloroflexota bacterium]